MSASEWSAWASWASIIIALGIAVVGWSHARRANAGAQIANEHAAEALKIAQSAERRADRFERIALERRDVSWERREVDDSETLSFQSVGSDTAHQVTLIVDPEDGSPRQTQRLPQLEPAGRIGIRLTTLANEARERFESAPPGILLSPGFMVRARITWTSESGVPDFQEWEEIHL